MFKVKLWVTVLLYVATGVTLVVLGTPRLYDALVPPLEERANAALLAVEAGLVVDSEASVSAAAALTAAPLVRDVVDPAKTPPAEPSEELLGALQPKVEGRLGAPAFGLIVDAEGVVRVKAGADPGLEASIAGIPALADALTGVMRDGLVVMDGKPFHIGVAPVSFGGKVAGAVLLGWRLDDRYVDALAARAGAPVVMLFGKSRIGSAVQELDAAALQNVGAGVPLGVFAPELLLPVPLPILVADTHRYFGASKPAYPGHNDARFVIAVDRNDALNTIANLQLAMLGGTLVTGFVMLLLVLNILRSISKPMQQIMDHLSQYAQGNPVGILPESALSGPFVRLGKQINMILQAPPPTSAARSGSPLSPPSLPRDAFDSTLEGKGPPPPPVTDPGEPPAEDESPSFEGIPGLGSTPPPPPADADADADAAGDAEAPPASPAPPAAPVASDFQESALSTLFDDNAADPLAAFRVPSGGAPASQPPTPPPAAPATPPPSPPGLAPLPGGGAPQPPQPPEDYNPEATAMFQVPEALLQAAQAGTSGPSMASPPPQQDEARTVIAQIPPELLTKSSGVAGISPAEEAHFKEVYDDFVKTRQQCGEDTQQLTYDRFVTKLMKNRQQIIEKYHSKSVRFQVYVKQGKAALRAVPVRE